MLKKLKKSFELNNDKKIWTETDRSQILCEKGFFKDDPTELYEVLKKNRNNIFQERKNDLIHLNIRQDKDMSGQGGHSENTLNKLALETDLQRSPLSSPDLRHHQGSSPFTDFLPENNMKWCLHDSNELNLWMSRQSGNRCSGSRGLNLGKRMLSGSSKVNINRKKIKLPSIVATFKPLVVKIMLINRVDAETNEEEEENRFDRFFSSENQINRKKQGPDFLIPDEEIFRCKNSHLSNADDNLILESLINDENENLDSRFVTIAMNDQNKNDFLNDKSDSCLFAGADFHIENDSADNNQKNLILPQLDLNNSLKSKLHDDFLSKDSFLNTRRLNTDNKTSFSISSFLSQKDNFCLKSISSDLLFSDNNVFNTCSFQSSMQTTPIDDVTHFETNIGYDIQNNEDKKKNIEDDISILTRVPKSSINKKPLKIEKKKNSVSEFYKSPNNLSSNNLTLPTRICISCGSDQSPCWRPSWSVTEGQLCNSCGLRYKKTFVRCLNVDCKKIPAKGEWSFMKKKGKVSFSDGYFGYSCLKCGQKVDTKFDT